MALSFSHSLLLDHHRSLLHHYGNYPFAPHFQPIPSNTHSLKSLSLSCSSTFNYETRVTLNTRNNSKTLSSPFACNASRYGGQESDKSYVEAYAVGRNIRMSADKARRVIDQIRGRSYEHTVMILELMPYRACVPILKIVFSAAANASHNLGLNKESLIISRCEVNEGSTMKRVRPRAQGRAYPIRKRTCHITVVVKGLPSEPQVEANPA